MTWNKATAWLAHSLETHLTASTPHLPLWVDISLAEPLRLRLVHVLPLALSHAQLQGRVTVGLSSLDLFTRQKIATRGRCTAKREGEKSGLVFPTLVRKMQAHGFLILRHSSSALCCTEPSWSLSVCVSRSLSRSLYVPLNKMDKWPAYRVFSVLLSPAGPRTHPAAGQSPGGAPPRSRKSPSNQPVPANRWNQ